jgi:hypothetical protein
MYPAQELNRLAECKSALVQKIILDRAQCVAATRQLARPVEWFDRVRDRWRRLSPAITCAAVPLGVWALRAMLRRRKIVRAAVRWGLVAAGIVRVIRASLLVRN